MAKNYGERHETGEVEPKGASKADTRSERHERKVDGVAEGKADKARDFNTGRTHGTCYEHKRHPHAQD